MALYNNLAKNSPLTAVEFTPVAEGNLSFFYVENPAHKEIVREWLSSAESGQKILAETEVKGRMAFITTGRKTQDELLQILTDKGDKLLVVPHIKPLDPWKKVSMLAVPGQLLQLASSFMRKDKRVDWDTFVFAGSNLLGHAIAWTYGAQRSDDKNRLNFLKEQVNEELGGYLAEDDKLPDVHDKRALLRHEPRGALSAAEKTNNFLKRNSVYVSEFLCRYMGAFALAFPANKWGKALKEDSLSGVYKTGRASFTDHPEKATLSHYAGLGSLTGKTIALFSKPEDPYHPKPKTFIDTLREKVTFRTGGLIEAASFATYATDSFTNPDRRILIRGKEYPDFVGGIGSLLFTIRYITRYWAKFGVKETNMEELYAHITDSLAKMPEAKLPQLLAETAAEVTNSFKEKKLEFGTVFTQLMSDLYRYHHISLNANDCPACVAPGNENTIASKSDTVVKTARAVSRRTLDRVTAPAGNYSDAVKTAGSEKAVGVGA